MLTNSTPQMLMASTHYTLRTVPFWQREEWDTFIEAHRYGHFLQSWGWGELKATTGWSPLRLALWDGERLVAVAQVLRKTGPHIPLAMGHLAYIPRGPVIDWEQPELCQIFFHLLHNYLYQQGALAVRWEPDVEAVSVVGQTIAQIAQTNDAQSIPPVQPLRTILLDLEPTEEQLLAQMKEKWRYNIRLGTRKGVTVRVADSLEDIQRWYDLLQTTGERDQFGIHRLAYYQRTWKIFAPQDTLRVLLAEYNGQLLAGIFVTVFAGQASYLYGASSNEQRQLMPNYVLQWEAIRWARRRGARLYDFWGIPSTDADDESMAGVYRFKRGWGGRTVQYLGGYEQVYRPMIMNVARRFV